MYYEMKVQRLERIVQDLNDKLNALNSKLSVEERNKPEIHFHYSQPILAHMPVWMGDTNQFNPENNPSWHFINKNT